MHDNTLNITQNIQTWLEDVVIGLGLCPFAAAPYRKNQVQIRVFVQQDLEEVAQVILDALITFIRSDPEETATTLLVFPHTLNDFDTYLAMTQLVEGWIEEIDADGIIQLATFHPDYQFEGESPEALSNYTNRAPYPIFHLLREDDVTHAVSVHPDPEGIPETNIETMNALGEEGIRRLWAHFAPE